MICGITQTFITLDFLYLAITDEDYRNVVAIIQGTGGTKKGRERLHQSTSAKD